MFIFPNVRYVKVDSLIGQIQLMGVETEHESSLEEALTEVLQHASYSQLNCTIVFILCCAI